MVKKFVQSICVMALGSSLIPAFAQIGPCVSGARAVQIQYVSDQNGKETQILRINGQKVPFTSKVPSGCVLVVTEVELRAVPSNKNVLHEISVDIGYWQSGLSVGESIYTFPTLIKSANSSESEMNFSQHFTTGVVFAPNSIYSIGYGSTGPDAHTITLRGYYCPVKSVVIAPAMDHNE